MKTILLCAVLVATGVETCFSAKIYGDGDINSLVAAPLSVNLIFNELGNGRLTNTTGVNLVVPSSVRADPGPGGLSAVLFYDMLVPPGLGGGDLLMLEPGSGVLTDMLRFDAQFGGVFVYSDISDSVDASGDIGFPAGRNTNLFQVTEVGGEGLNGITYTPVAGQPGFIVGAAGPVTYSFASDGSIPEPSSMLLLLTGGAVLLRRRFRR